MLGFYLCYIPGLKPKCTKYEVMFRFPMNGGGEQVGEGYVRSDK